MEDDVVHWSDAIMSADDEESLLSAFVMLERNFMAHPVLFMSMGKGKIIEVCNRY